MMTAQRTSLQSDRNHVPRFAAALSAWLCAFALQAPVAHAAESGARSGQALPVQAAALSEVNVPGTSPMGAAADDLAATGYSEREFYASGKANRYRGVLPRTIQTGQVIDGDWPYRTRVLVRAPSAAKFNGTLVVEWANVTLGQDVDFAFAESYQDLLREGFAVAVVSVQRLGVDRLKTWSPGRYGDLTVTADNTDPQNGSKIDDCIAGTGCPGDRNSGG